MILEKPESFTFLANHLRQYCNFLKGRNTCISI